jgi:hypothetical protein
MIRRTLALAAVTLAVAVVCVPSTSGAATSALVIGPKLGSHSLCIGASNGDPNQLDGICIWLPGT